MSNPNEDDVPALVGGAGEPLSASPWRRFVLAVMALALGHLSACASLAAYQARHPYYKFPSSGFGVGGGPNG